MPHQIFPRKTVLEDNTTMRRTGAGARPSVSGSRLLRRLSAAAKAAADIGRQHEKGSENIDVGVYMDIIKGKLPHGLGFDEKQVEEWLEKRKEFAGYKIPNGWTQIDIPEDNVRAICIAQYMRNSLVVLYQQNGDRGLRHMVVEYIKDENKTLTWERGLLSDALSDFYDYHGLGAVTGSIKVNEKNKDGTTATKIWRL